MFYVSIIIFLPFLAEISDSVGERQPTLVRSGRVEFPFAAALVVLAPVTFSPTPSADPARVHTSSYERGVEAFRVAQISLWYTSRQ